MVRLKCRYLGLRWTGAPNLGRDDLELAVRRAISDVVEPRLRDLYFDQTTVTLVVPRFSFGLVRVHTSIKGPFIRDVVPHVLLSGGTGVHLVHVSGSVVQMTRWVVPVFAQEIERGMAQHHNGKTLGLSTAYAP
ncbi:hypothetical protein GMRT_15161 [Giardia muris]|uniref:Uncharacterized protein n=1 Tax=Giardia muris TaxID=5742 RepID=A0A4Z1T4U1_GIAMU|nr:hypothetical protein GMRT_15161 [Giardia muris]|eukprot:TNJ28097.1 hypothetical protein GMRT_15161 [Giardia muris]